MRVPPTQRIGAIHFDNNIYKEHPDRDPGWLPKKRERGGSDRRNAREDESAASHEENLEQFVSWKIEAAARSSEAHQTTHQENSRDYAGHELTWHDEHAPQRHATPNVAALYRAVKSGTFHPHPLAAEERALEYASRTLSGFQKQIRAINDFSDRVPSAGAAFGGAVQDPSLTARRHLFVEAEEFARAFNIDEPLIEVRNGRLALREFDIRFQGETIARSLGNGSTAEYRDDGSLILDHNA